VDWADAELVGLGLDRQGKVAALLRDVKANSSGSAAFLR
jgi:hypothetical protein